MSEPENKTVQFHLRLTPRLMALVEREAQHKQVSKSAVIRGALIDRYIGRAMDAMWKAERETA